MSGLKSETQIIKEEPLRSHPVWDEWIEIYHDTPAFLSVWSHPVWDEWIEILLLSSLPPERQTSHPVWDEWIEIRIGI